MAKWAFGVEMVELISTLHVVKSDVGVKMSCEYVILSPPTVSCVLLGSAFCGR